MKKSLIALASACVLANATSAYAGCSANCLYKTFVPGLTPQPSSQSAAPSSTSWGWYNKGTLQPDQLTWNAPASSAYEEIIANNGHNAGKWYFEATLDSMTTNNLPEIGVIPVSSQAGGISRTGDAAIFAYSGGSIARNNTAYASVVGASKGTVGVAVDLDKNTVSFYVNCTLQNSSAFSMTGAFNQGTTIYPFVTVFGGVATTVVANFGQHPFACTPPAGYQTSW